MDEQIEQIARAIANCEWDQACSALGTPNHPRGGNWTAKLPQARAAHSVMAGTVAELTEANANLRGALETAGNAFRRYAELHRAKGTTEGNLKASNNDDLAEFCESVIADAALAPPRHD